MRFRTACDLKKEGEIAVTLPSDWRLPDREALKTLIPELIQKCQPMFASPAVTELKTKVKIKDQRGEESEA